MFNLEVVFFVYVLGCIVAIMVAGFAYGEFPEEDKECDSILTLVMFLVSMTLLSWVTIAMYLGERNRKNKEGK